MVSRWLIITLSAIAIVSALVIVIAYTLLKKSDEDERAADEVYLRSKASLLKLAVDKNMNANSGVLNGQIGKILNSANSTNKIVQQSTNNLEGLIARQKAAIESIKERYRAEKVKMLNK